MGPKLKIKLNKLLYKLKIEIENSYRPLALVETKSYHEIINLFEEKNDTDRNMGFTKTTQK